MAKVWGTVKYFHPYLASREIDWDKALIDTLPKVNAAKTPQEYQAALNQMLAVLNDKSTRAQFATETKPAASAPSTSTKPVRMDNGVLIIDATQIAQAVTENMSALNGFVADINKSLPNAKSVIIDARATRKMGEFEAYHFDNFIRQTLPMMLDQNRGARRNSLSHAQRLRHPNRRWLQFLLLGHRQLCAKDPNRPKQNQNASACFHHQRTIARVRRRSEWHAVSRSRFDRAGKRSAGR